MQPLQDSLTVPRRTLDVEDYIDIVRRHKSWIVGPAFAALVISVVAAFLWPDTYLSVAVLQVVPPQVSEKYVPSNINSEMTQRINAMAQKIRARDYLTNIINTNNLYPSERQRKPLEDVLEQMNRAIRISPVVSLQQQSGRTPISAFQVSFEYSNRFLARKVTQQLVSGFMDENIRTLAAQSAATTDFLKGQWDEAKQRLEELENKMAAFRQKNAGRLPDQLQANLQTLRALETQLAGINEVINRIGQERLLLESQLRIYKDQLAALAQGGSQLSAQVRNQQLVQTERQIISLETAISALKERYKDTYPDVKTAEAQLAMLRNKRDSLLKAQQAPQDQPAAPEADPAASEVNARTAKQLEAVIARLQSEIQVKEIQLDERTKTQKRLTDLIDAYNARIDAVPMTEKEYGELTRDLDMARGRYQELNLKKAQSEAATTVENQGRGERLELLDQASLPERPTKPKRLLIIGAGLGIGLVLGAFIAGARELKDTSLKNLKDARAYTNLPVLGTIPLLENDLVVRRKRRLAWVAWSAASMLGILAMTSSIYYYYATKL